MTEIHVGGRESPTARWSFGRDEVFMGKPSARRVPEGKRTSSEWSIVEGER